MEFDLVLFSIITGIVLSMLAVAPSAYAQVVTDSNTFTTFDELSGNSLHIIGEARNNAAFDIDSAQVTSNIYDAEGRMIGTSITFTQPSQSPINAVAPYLLPIESFGASLIQKMLPI